MNSGILCNVMPGARMLKMVTMKFIAPSSEEDAGEVQREQRAVHPHAELVGRERQRRIQASSRCRIHP